MDDHPGGDEVLLAATGLFRYKYFFTLYIKKPVIQLFNRHVKSVFIGKDATNDFEDVGHSDSAREMMDKYYIGKVDVSTVPLKRTYVPPQQAHYNQDKTPEFIIKILQFMVPLLILGLAFVVRHYTKKEEQNVIYFVSFLGMY